MDKANEHLEDNMEERIDVNLLSMEGFRGSHAMPLVLAFQADGGPDQNIMFLRTRLAHFAVFLLSGADRCMFFRGAQGESYRLFCERCMSLLQISISNCSFMLDYSALSPEDAWFIDKIMNTTGTMAETRQAINDFNEQLAVVIRVKQRIQARNTSISVNNIAKMSGGESEVAKNYQEESDAGENDDLEAGNEDDDVIAYDKGYEFDCFLTGAGWFVGTVIEVEKEEDLRLVEFDGDDSKPTVMVTVEELDKRCEEPELGEIGFRFVKKFPGNVIMNGKVVDISSKNRFVCRFDDGDVKTYLKKTLESLMAMN